MKQDSTHNALTLAQMKIGDKATILKITGKTPASSDCELSQAELEHRLLEAGMLEGDIIEVLHQGPVGRDPIAVKVNDMIVALRRNEAGAVFVDPNK